MAKAGHPVWWLYALAINILQCSRSHAKKNGLIAGALAFGFTRYHLKSWAELLASYNFACSWDLRKLPVSHVWSRFSSWLRDHSQIFQAPRTGWSLTSPPSSLSASYCTRFGKKRWSNLWISLECYNVSIRTLMTKSTHRRTPNPNAWHFLSNTIRTMTVQLLEAFNNLHTSRHVIIQIWILLDLLRLTDTETSLLVSLSTEPALLLLWKKWPAVTNQ
jgi:hypothetical protein